MALEAIDNNGEELDGKKYNPYFDLLVVTELNDGGLLFLGNEQAFRVQSLRNLRDHGYDLGVVGVVEKPVGKKKNSKTVVDVLEAKQTEYNEFVKDLSQVREAVLGNTDKFSDTPVLNEILATNQDGVTVEDLLRTDLSEHDIDDNIDKTNSDAEGDAQSKESRIGQPTKLPEVMSTSLGETSGRVLSLDIVRRIIDSPEGETVMVKGVPVEINLDMLNDTETGKENVENFKALVQHFWRDLGVHGIVEENRELGRVEGEFPLKLKKKSDLDGDVCRLLFSMVGIKEDVRFIYPGRELTGSLTVDSGKRRFVSGEDGDVQELDGITTIYEKVMVGGREKMVVTTVINHHARDSKSDTSAARYVYEGLVEMGLLEPKDGLTKLVEFVTSVDNGVPPKEMDEVRQEYNKTHGTNLSKREFFQGKWSNTVWTMKNFVKLPNLVKFFENGGDPTRVIEDERDFRKLGIVYEQGAEYKKVNGKRKKIKEGEVKDLRLKIRENVERSLSALQEIEKKAKILITQDGRRIVVDEGGLMGGLGSQISRDLGYDGYVSFKEKENSFMVWTRKPLEVEFDQGFNVREHMWVKKSKDGNEKINLGDICKRLSGTVNLEWSNGLLSEDMNGRSEKNDKENMEKKKRDELLGYLVRNLSGDLMVMFGGSDMSKKTEVSKLWTRLDIGPFMVGMDGADLSRIVKEFFAMDRGVPQDWERWESKLKQAKIDIKDMDEARRRKKEFDGEDVEKGQEMSERVRYYGEHLVQDLLDVYKENGSARAYGEAAKRLNENGVLPLLIKISGKDNLDRKNGADLAITLQEFFAMNEGFPEMWSKAVKFLGISRIDVADLEVARNRLRVGGSERGKGQNEKSKLKESKGGEPVTSDVLRGLPALEGEQLREYPGIRFDLRLLSNPVFRSAAGFAIVRDRLMQKAGLDVDSLVSSASELRLSLV